MSTKALRNPFLGAIGGVVSVIWEAFWLVGPPVGIDASNRRAYLVWGFFALVICVTQAFLAMWKRNRDLLADLAQAHDALADSGPRIVPVYYGRERGNSNSTSYGIEFENHSDDPAYRLDLHPLKIGQYTLDFAWPQIPQLIKPGFAFREISGKDDTNSTKLGLEWAFRAHGFGHATDDPKWNRAEGMVAYSDGQGARYATLYDVESTVHGIVVTFLRRTRIKP